MSEVDQPSLFQDLVLTLEQLSTTVRHHPTAYTTFLTMQELTIKECLRSSYEAQEEMKRTQLERQRLLLENKILDLQLLPVVARIEGLQRENDIITQQTQKLQ